MRRVRAPIIQVSGHQEFSEGEELQWEDRVSPGHTSALQLCCASTSSGTTSRSSQFFPLSWCFKNFLS